MRSDSFSLRFYPASDRKNLLGEYPIYIRITVNRRKVEIATKQTLKNLSDWDDITQRVRLKTPINAFLNKIEADITKVYDGLKFKGKPITATIIKDLFLGRGKTIPTLTEYMDRFYSEGILANPEMAETTKKNYKTTITHINSYLDYSNQKKITLAELDNRFIRALDTFLISTPIVNSIRTLRRNTVNKYHFKFRTIINVALEEGLIEKSPFINVKIKNEDSTRTFLTKPELEAIKEHSLSGNESLKRVRDIFLFSVYTGLRFFDAIQLKEENIESDGKKLWINIRQQKTKEFIRIPILKPAVEIYEKHLIERSTTGYVLPRISNQKINAYLKTIAELVGLKKKLTHHVARHTAATTIFLANGVPLEVVSRQLGHSSIKTTQIYAKITNDMLSKAADMVDEKMKML